ncbi:carboxylating nicotinate-nucleotide diphosphorylase [Sporocytophaga myxococcoides]|uniref:carboxylating nicotinate-nucleotide diphosphorylase n=1 Tax=Sporocytophaga myxococcoides TaxID=153721 RepID=UPI0004161197|nr:carboxylating nicotinate-nucleotide diphosphorylase [Sporocytophaga myxococcoides]
MNFLSEQAIFEFIDSALAEDVGNGDHSTLASVPADAINKAQLLVKDEGVLAGVALSEMIFSRVDPDLRMEILIPDGIRVKPKDVAFKVHGRARSILTGERLVLNCMQRMSGIATLTTTYNELIRDTGCKLLDTRKTTPNFRLPEKWAVAIGGGVNHRFGLYDMIILKDNHIDFAGGIKQAIESTKNYLQKHSLSLKIEVETRSLKEVEEVLNVGGIDRIMLDNMSPQLMKEAVALIARKFETEASGGINESTIRSYALTGVDYISCGALTHSFRSLDLSLKAF